MTKHERFEAVIEKHNDYMSHYLAWLENEEADVGLAEAALAAYKGFCDTLWAHLSWEIA